MDQHSETRLRVDSVESVLSLNSPPFCDEMPEPLVTAAPSSDLQRERLPVSGAALLVLALAPSALVLLLLLHCMLLGYKLLLLAKKRKGARRGGESALSSSHSASHSPPPSARRSATRYSCGHARKACFSSAPELGPPVTSSLASSVERRVRLLRPDGAAAHAGSSSLRSWRRGSAPVLLLHSSDSEAGRCNLVPPNSPEQLATNNGRASLPVRMMRRSSTMELELISLDKLHVEGEIISSIPQETSCFVASASSSAAGPGLDSDFGASADSDGFPGGAWASGLEWDYYDPSYVTQNHVPKHRHHAPPITIKQYWV